MTNAAGVTGADHPGEEPPRMARFGTFEVDLRSGELRRDGRKIRIQEQPFRMLVLLLERAGEVVTREELRERLWPSDFVDFDRGLNTAAGKLRSALDDHAENPRFVETVARRGYRFIAPVTWSFSVGPLPSGEDGAKRRVTVALLAMLILFATVALTIYRARQAPVPQPVNAIAVLPFTTDDAANEHIGGGLTEILIDTLSRLPNLRVMARTSVFKYREGPVDPKRAGKELNVGAVVTGNVRREGNGLAIHVELVDARDGAQIWGRQYRSSPGELARSQNLIAEDLTRQLRGDVTTDRRQILARRYTTSPEAYDLYLKGLHTWHNRKRGDLRKSVDYFKAAIALDPQFAAAYAGLASSYGVMGGYGMILPKEGAVEVLAAAQKALELDPQNAEAYTSLATTKYRNLWDFAGAERDYRRAIELNPNYATAHQWYADYLWSMGRMAEAREEVNTAYTLDPFSFPINGSMCWSYFNERRFRDAIAFGQRAAATDPDLKPHQCMVQSYVALGEGDAAAAEILRGPMANPAIEAAYRKSGSRGLVQVMLKGLIDRQGGDVNTPVEIATMYAAMGNADEAFHWLEKAYVQRSSRLTSFHLHPAFDPLRTDPRMTGLLRRIGLPADVLERLPAAQPR